MNISVVHRTLLVFIVISLSSLFAVHVMSGNDDSTDTMKDLPVFKDRTVLSDFMDYRINVSIAINDRDPQRIVDLSNDVLERLSTLEDIEIAPGISLDKETSLHLEVQANLASVYDRMGYCFHAYNHYFGVIDIITSDFTLIRTLDGLVRDPRIDEKTYRQFKGAYIHFSSPDLPFKRCIKRKKYDELWGNGDERN